MPSQVVGLIEDSQASSACGWQSLVEATSDWRSVPVEVIEADTDQLQDDLTAEWQQLQERLG